MTRRRIFVAIDIPDVARSHISSYMASLQGKFGDLRAKWERPEKLHITIRFAGDLDEVGLAALTRSVRYAAGKSWPFTTQIAQTGAFLKRRGPSVLWLGLVTGNHRPGKGPFQEIFADLEPDADGKARSAFTPHITIARIRDPLSAKRMAARHLASEFAPVEFEVSELVIYESELCRAGSVYTVVSKHRLVKPAGTGLLL